MIAVIAGTSEAKDIISQIDNMCEVEAYVATELGRDMLPICNCKVHIGRLDYDGFCRELADKKMVIDASHPFAVEVSENVKTACESLQIKYIRVSRESQIYDYDNIIWVENKEAAARILNNIDGNILFTTGANTVRYYSKAVVDFENRAVSRILKSPMSDELCREFDKNIIRQNPPFSVEDNIKCIKDYKAKVLVSKDSGKRGGVLEKVEACKFLGIPIIIIKSPDEDNKAVSILDIKEMIDKLI